MVWANVSSTTENGLYGLQYPRNSFVVKTHLYRRHILYIYTNIYTLGLQPCQKVVRTTQPSSTTFPGGVWRPKKTVCLG